MRSLVLPLLLLAGCGGGTSDTLLVFGAQGLTASVTIATTEVLPGTMIHGEGVLAGGTTCARIDAFYAYRTDDRVVFVAEEGLGFCFATDLYQVVLDNVIWQGAEGSLVLLNDGDPRIAGNTNGLAFFQPLGGTGFFVDEISVEQFFEPGVDNLLLLSVRTTQFSFFDDTMDTFSVFPVRLQIERLLQDGTSPLVDRTDSVNVDLVDPGAG